MEQYPSEIRSQILDEHKAIRKQMDHLVEMASSQSTQDELKEAARGLCDMLFDHIDREEKLLIEELSSIDAFGKERVEALKQEHVVQRKALKEVLSRIESAEGLDVVSTIVGLRDRILEDMRDEEETYLDPELLKDTLVNTDVGT